MRRICWNVRKGYIGLVPANVLVVAVIREGKLEKGHIAPLVIVGALVEADVIDAKRLQTANLFGDGAVKRRVAGMDTRDILALVVSGHDLVDDVIKGQ